jgi:hypothetical protein
VEIPSLAVKLKDQVAAQQVVWQSVGRKRCAVLDEHEQCP